MTQNDKGHYAEKHSKDKTMNPEIADVVKKKALEGEIPCAVAFTIIDDMKVKPEEVGFTIDLLEVRILKCQLGLFGYQLHKRIVEPAENVTKDLEQAINDGLVNRKLPCITAWDIAKKFGKRRMEVSSACEAMKIKIGPCQLGAF